MISSVKASPEPKQPCLSQSPQHPGFDPDTDCSPSVATCGAVFVLLFLRFHCFALSLSRIYPYRTLSLEMAVSRYCRRFAKSCLITFSMLIMRSAQIKRLTSKPPPPTHQNSLTRAHPPSPPLAKQIHPSIHPPIHPSRSPTQRTTHCSRSILWARIPWGFKSSLPLAYSIT